MIKITIQKPFRKGETLRLLELTDVVELIRGDEYRELVSEMRTTYPVLNEYYEERLPRLCFAQELEHRNGQRVSRGYTGLVLLEVNNLTGYDEAAAVRNGAGEMPQTLLAFVGASGRSVKIVCRGEVFGSQGTTEPQNQGATEPRNDRGTLPQATDDIKLFHENLYERARLAYNAQLGVTIQKLEPLLDRTCLVSCDPEAVFNPMAMPLYARAEKPTEHISLIRTTTVEPAEVSPGESRYYSLYHVFEYNVEKAYDDCEGQEHEADYKFMLLTRIAVHCCETGIPMAIARRLTLFHSSSIGASEELATKVYSNVYRSKQMKRYEEQKNVKAEKNIPAETLLTKKIDIFLQENYEIRKNVMRGVAEFRERTGVGFSFRDLTEEARNSITMRALRQGIKCWDKDIRRYVNSEDIELYDPMNEWLEALPRWDGKDRVDTLARRIPTDYDQWPVLFRLWMRSMVAMWMGMGQLTGNALVPLLIGRQGCGKSSFCRLLLPSDLQDYYNDRINFKNENDLNLGLTSFGLINLDEFDKITERQQIVLKYLVSTADLKYRPPYGKAYSQHRRFASFIGTTNETAPLTDPSGSRRFVCTLVTGDIDFRTPLDHQQLYAQLKHEIDSGERYWPDREQEAELIRHNQRFQQISGLGEMLLSIVERPQNDDDGQWMTLKDLSTLLRQHFRGYKEDAGTFRKIGAYLSRPEYQFKSTRRKSGMVYWVKVRE